MTGDQDGTDRSTPARRGAGPAGRPSAASDEARDGGDSTVVTSLADIARQAQTGDKTLPHLVVIAGEHVGKYFCLDHAVTHLGRGESCEVQIHDGGISRKHARVLINPGGEVWLEDLGSTNGTFVENQRIDRLQLHDGDRIQLGRTTIIKFSVTDATELRFAEQMYVSATQDALTRVNNRQFFDDEFRKEFAFATRHGIPLSVLMIDIDFFKKVNDTYGHTTGDLALKMVARTLSRSLRTEDILARYGGEEFVVLTRGTDGEAAVALGERIRHTVESQLVPNAGSAFRVTVSVGAATLVPGSSLESRSDLLAAADTAMYRAKRNGRNRVEQWHEGDALEHATAGVEDTVG
jgi:diguanylate cyclase (GGDEF)-like protein